MDFPRSSQAASPVLAAILMIGVVVALSVSVGVFTFNLTDSTSDSEPSQAAVSVSPDTDEGTVSLQVVTAKEGVSYQVESSDEPVEIGGAGDGITLREGVDYEEGERITVLSEGNVVQTIDTSGVGGVSPVAAPSATPADAEFGESIDFDGSDSYYEDGSIETYDWDFDDGNTATGEVVSHTYDSSGTYEVKLTVTADDGRTATDTVNVHVDEDEPVANAYADPQEVVTGETVSFDGSDSDYKEGTIESYDWDFGDGTTGSGETTTHSYDSAGDYVVELTVTTDDGKTDTDTVTVSVTESTLVVDDFERGNLDPYGGSTEFFNIHSGDYTYSGNYALEASVTCCGDSITSTSGLDHYPERGDRLTWNQYFHDHHSWGETYATKFSVRWAVNPDTGEQYYVMFNGRDYTLKLNYYDGTDTYTLDEASVDWSSYDQRWLHVEADFSDPISVTVHDESTGSEVATVESSHTAGPDTGGVRFYIVGDVDHEGQVYVDDWTAE